MTIIRTGNGNVIDDNNALPTKTIESTIIQPTERQSVYAETIQTHNNITVALSGASSSAWIDANGFDKVGLTYTSATATSSRCQIMWSTDGTNTHGQEMLINTNSNLRNAAVFEVKARYFQVLLENQDASTPKAMSAWAYLKA